MELNLWDRLFSFGGCIYFIRIHENATKKINNIESEEDFHGRFFH